MAPIIEWLKHQKLFLLGGLFILAILGFFILTLKAKWVVENIKVKETSSQKEIYKAFNKNGAPFSQLALPQEEKDRLDILVVGMRGAGVGFGDFLTDTMMLISIDKQTGQAAMISIPRDLSIALPYNGKMKINELYTIGYYKGGEKLAFGISKTVVSQITGVYVDGMVVIDFEAFTKIIDIVGGVDIYLDKPFVEITQWQGVGGFRLPAGLNHLNGEQALFYARSRFATSDFDRARRQQDLILALHKKVVSLGILSNPIKIYNILDAIGTHVKSDVALSVPETLALANKIDYRNIHRLLLTTQNYLYHDTAPNGAYILLPKKENFSEIQRAVINIFNENSLPVGVGDNLLYERAVNRSEPLQNSTTTRKTSQTTQKRS